MRGQEETFGGDGYVYYLDDGGGFMNIPYVQTHQIVYIKQFLCISCVLIKPFKKHVALNYSFQSFRH